MSLLQLIIISLVQGITEWLPISSSGHVLLAANLFTLEGRDELLINAVSNLGTLAAMLIYFRLIRTLGSLGTASQSYLRAGVGVLLGMVFLGETMSLSNAAGLCLAIAGVAIINWPRRS